MFGDSLHVTMKMENENNNFQFSTFNSQLNEIQPSVEDCFIAFNLNK